MWRARKAVDRFGAEVDHTRAPQCVAAAFGTNRRPQSTDPLGQRGTLLSRVFGRLRQRKVGNLVEFKENRCRITVTVSRYVMGAAVPSKSIPTRR